MTRAAAGSGGAGRIAVVTGGAGFLGSRVALALDQAGWRVRLLVHRSATHPVLAGTRLELVRGDMRDAAALSRLVQDAAVVVHAAGLVKARSRVQFMRVNRDGTRMLAEAVARHQPQARFILVSSLAARAPHLSGYAASKRMGEAAAVAELGSGGCLVLRPGVIYGPWDQAGLALLRLASGRFAPLVRPEPRIAMLHVADAAACVAALAAGGPAAGMFELCDERADGYRWSELLRRIGSALGRSPHPVPAPDLLIRAAGATSEAWGMLRHRPPLFGTGKAREILHRDWSSDPALHLPSALWTPRIPLDDGLAELVAWWRDMSRHASLMKSVSP
ncbi:NAD-dependent epimerase/dehydratase family protein [Lichenicoccus sp.]|uniref:NAD-dependent epimerase/dehydratase family protein n=1 Tax=Lichenicoccus sp. TaxID=2781899 RepID=UPI003D13BB8D